jgi:two-component sensor histidine kinase
MGVIVTEAINNAIKYAGRDEGAISIEVTLEGDGNKKPLRVTVEDDGAGFDEDSDQAGFGSQITEALSTSLRAQLSRSYVRPVGPRRGTRIQLDFSSDALAA